MMFSETDRLKLLQKCSYITVIYHIYYTIKIFTAFACKGLVGLSFSGPIQLLISLIVYPCNPPEKDPFKGKKRQQRAAYVG